MAITLWQPGTTGYPEVSDYASSSDRTIETKWSFISDVLSDEPFAEVGQAINTYHINALRRCIEILETHVHTFHPCFDQAFGNTAQQTFPVSISQDYPSSTWTGKHYVVLDDSGTEISAPSKDGTDSDGNYNRNTTRYVSRVVPDLYTPTVGCPASQKINYRQSGTYLTPNSTYAASSTPVVTADSINADHINQLRRAVESLMNHTHDFRFRLYQDPPSVSTNFRQYLNIIGSLGAPAPPYPISIGNPSSNWFGGGISNSSIALQNNTDEPTAAHVNHIKEVLFYLLKHRHKDSSYSTYDPSYWFTTGAWRAVQYGGSPYWYKAGAGSGGNWPMNIWLPAGRYLLVYKDGQIYNTRGNQYPTRINYLQGYQFPSSVSNVLSQSFVDVVSPLYLSLQTDGYVSLWEYDQAGETGDNTGQINFWLYKESTWPNIPEDTGGFYEYI